MDRNYPRTCKQPDKFALHLFTGSGQKVQPYPFPQRYSYSFSVNGKGFGIVGKMDESLPAGNYLLYIRYYSPNPTYTLNLYFKN